MQDSRAIDLFLEMMAAERNAARNTQESYRRDLRHVGTFAQTQGRNLMSLTPDDVRAYLQSLGQAGMTARTAARRLSALRQFFAFAKAENLRGDDPTITIDAPKMGRSLPKILSEDEVVRLLDAIQAGPSAETIRLKALVETLYATGLRVSELVALPLAVLQRDARMITVRGKGNKERLVPLGDEARAAIAAYLPVRAAALGKGVASPWLFPSRGRSGHLTRQRFGQMLKELAIKAGLAPSRLSPHVLRHAFATHMLNHGADLRSLQKLLGHADIATTQIYTHVAGDQLAELVQQFHPLAAKRTND